MTSALNNVAPVVLNGFYSILNTVYNKLSSTLVAQSVTGGSTNSVDYFQYINAEKIITTGGDSDNWNSAYTVATTYQTASAKFVRSDTSLVTSTPAPSALFNIVALSQVAYDSLSPNYNATTLYVIV